jgi:hypothetical protein
MINTGFHIFCNHSQSTNAALSFCCALWVNGTFYFNRSQQNFFGDSGAQTLGFL